MATLKTEFLDPNRQQVIHPTGEVVVAGTYTHSGTPANGDVFQLCTVPANAVITGVKIALVPNAAGTATTGGGAVSLGTSTAAAAFRAATAIIVTNPAVDNIGLPVKYSTETIVTATTGTALAGGQTIGYAVSYTTEFAIPGSE
tara:strand:- start:2546 stop:2977 length:432 start_codon:yes stop_codon:yes gene_type:complete